MLLAEIALFTAGFIVGTFGNTSTIKRVISPVAYHGERAFYDMMHDQPVTPDTKGYAALNDALLDYCKQEQWSYHGAPIQSVAPKAYEYRHSIVNGDKVLVIVMANDQLVNVAVDDLKDHLDQVTTVSTYPAAITLFALGLLLLLVQHFVNYENRAEHAP